MIAEAVAFFGDRFNLLFNNAGAGFPGIFGEHTIADWKIAFDLNFYSALYGMRAVLPLMVKQGGEQILLQHVNKLFFTFAFSFRPLRTLR